MAPDPTARNLLDWVRDAAPPRLEGDWLGELYSAAPGSGAEVEERLVLDLPPVGPTVTADWMDDAIEQAIAEVDERRDESNVVRPVFGRPRQQSAYHPVIRELAAAAASELQRPRLELEGPNGLLLVVEEIEPTTLSISVRADTPETGFVSVGWRHDGDSPADDVVLPLIERRGALVSECRAIVPAHADVSVSAPSWVDAATVTPTDVRTALSIESATGLTRRAWIAVRRDARLQEATRREIERMVER